MSEQMIEAQKSLEELFGRHQLMDVLRDSFAPLSDDPFKIDVVCQIYLHKQADPTTMVGLFSPKYGTPQNVANGLTECVEENLLDYDMHNRKLVLRYEISQEIEEALARYQFPLPMIVPPKELKNNKQGSGYLTNKDRLVLNASNIFDEEDICLDHLNRFNKVPLTLDLSVLTSEQGEFHKPVRKDGEMWDDYLKRVKQAQKFYDVSKEVMEGLLVLGNTFYLTNKYDRRGRTYSVGYHVNPQGTDENKAVLQFANQEVIK